MEMPREEGPGGLSGNSNADTLNCRATDKEMTRLRRRASQRQGPFKFT